MTGICGKPIPCGDASDAFGKPVLVFLPCTKTLGHDAPVMKKRTRVSTQHTYTLSPVNGSLHVGP